MDKLFKLETDLLKACAPVMSADEARFYLMGVNIRCKDGELTYAATNGHVLVKVESALEQDDDVQDFNITIPASMVKNIISKSFIKALGADEQLKLFGWIDAAIDATRIQIEASQGTYSQKLIDGIFPDVEKVIPNNASFAGKEFEFLGFNISYISALSKSLHAFSGDYISEFAPTEQQGPAKFYKSAERGKWTGVLMPVRV